MKKILLFISSVIVGATGFAQTIPNGGFETWTSGTVATGWSSQWLVSDATYGVVNSPKGPLTGQVNDSASVLFGKYGMMIYSYNATIAYLPGISVSGVSAVPSLTVSGASSTYSITGSVGYTTTTTPKTLSGFARYRTKAGGSNKAGILVEMFNNGTYIGGYSSTVTPTPFTIDTVAANAGFVNFNIPLTAAGSADSIIIIMLTSATTSMTPTASDTLWVDGLRFLACQPDPTVTLVSGGSTSVKPATAIDSSFAINGSGAFTQVFTIAAPYPGSASITFGGASYGPFPYAPLDSIVWDPIGPAAGANAAPGALPVGLTYTPGYPTGVQYGNSIYCFTISGNVPTTKDTTYKLMIDQTAYGVINASSVGFGTVALPSTFPANSNHLATDSITLNIVSAPAVPTITSKINGTESVTLTSSAATGNQWYTVSGTDTTKVSGATSATYTATSNASYIVKVTNVAGSAASAPTSVTTGVESYGSSSFNLSQNVPNPFNGTTTITFTAVNGGTVQFTVTNILGIVVSSQTINASAGENTITFSAGSVSPGTYFYSVSDGTNSATKKLIIY